MEYFSPHFSILLFICTLYSLLIAPRAANTVAMVTSDACEWEKNTKPVKPNVNISFRVVLALHCITCRLSLIKPCIVMVIGKTDKSAERMSSNKKTKAH